MVKGDLEQVDDTAPQDVLVAEGDTGDIAKTSEAAGLKLAEITRRAYNAPVSDLPPASSWPIFIWSHLIGTMISPSKPVSTGAQSS